MPKVEKESTKRKKEKQIHPNSRKASQLSRALHKDEKRLKRKDEHGVKLSALRDKVFWFKCQLEEGKQKYSLVEVSELISRYIQRFKDRLDEIEIANELIKKQGRHGRAHASEIDGIKMVVEKERAMFITGQFEAPDLTNRKNLKVLREWDGELKGLPSIKLKTFKEASIGTMEVEKEGEDLEE